MNELHVPITDDTNHSAWQPEQLTDTQTVGLLGFGHVWVSADATEEAGRLRGAVEALERRKRRLAEDIAHAQQAAIQQVHDDVQMLIAAFNRALERHVDRATEVAWSIARVLVETASGPSLELRNQIVALVQQHRDVSIRSSCIDIISIDDLMNIVIKKDPTVPQGSLEIDLPDARFVIGLERLRQLIDDDVRAYVRAPHPRVVQRPASDRSWGDA